ncbi:MAG: hypothetical protein H6537_00145 [Bacteroidales bacterium]|nr:hypothetical protein [Bacteroidales bacterium]HRX31151.1 hypothetical protein [Tenuifilaceae bacterium]
MIKISKVFTLCLMAFFAVTSCNSTKQKSCLFDASRFSYGISPQEVIKIMGEKPDSAFNKSILGKERYILLYFDKDSTEFRFAKNKLLEFIVHKPNFPFTPNTIAELNLPILQPTQMDTTAFIKWYHAYRNFDVVNFYLVGSKKDERTVRYNMYFKLKGN